MQQGPEVEMLAAEDRVYVKARGVPGEDSLESVAQCCHTQFMFLWNKDDMAFVRATDVNVVRPD
ncbi:hypothetical protein [Natrialba swarupiae]|uniref:Uncharacterized protein n=1 Tax=Natrialba swarupiae TaxID=2448032 RepID=A0A5D5AIN5_9EURY|nr:hypothetical protein [Natrialba swarupiae]TYT60875.1 hypothetical protein FYC77_16750 [Natrialba swarupiae]